MHRLHFDTIGRRDGRSGALRGFTARLRWIPLVFALVTVSLSSNAEAGTCGGELSAFQWEVSSLPLPIVAAGPMFPPGREAETLLVVSSLYRAARSMARLGKVEQCLAFVAEARSKLEALKEAG